MTISFNVHLAIDDNSGRDEQAFTSDASFWSMFDDYGLTQCSDSRLFHCLGFDLVTQHSVSPNSLRGFPSFIRPSVGMKEYYDSTVYVSWFNAHEFLEIMGRPDLELASRPRSVQTLVAVVRLIAESYSPTRVVIIYSFD